jgi:putative endonuclease
MTYSVYILRCADDSLYTGVAVDVQRRLGEHRGGRRGAKYLRGRLPVDLVFEHVVGERGDALRLEHQIKRLSRAEKEELIAGRMTIAPVQASGAAAG